jgi:hypothetical protein
LQLHRATESDLRAVQVTVDVKPVGRDRDPAAAIASCSFPQVDLAGDLGAVKDHHSGNGAAVQADQPVRPHPGAI